MAFHALRRVRHRAAVSEANPHSESERPAPDASLVPRWPSPTSQGHSLEGRPRGASVGADDSGRTSEASNLVQLEARDDATSNARSFVIPGEEHVLWGGDGTMLPDGGVTTPAPSRDGETTLEALHRRVGHRRRRLFQHP